MFIYLIANRANGKYYVGKTVQANLQKYLKRKLYLARSGSPAQPLLFRAMRKYEAQHFTIHALTSCLKSDEELKRWEREFIALLKARDPEVGYNLSAGGDGVTMTPAVRSKLSATRKRLWAEGKLVGHPMSEATRERQSTTRKEKLKDGSIKHGRWPDTHIKQSKAENFRKWYQSEKGKAYHEQKRKWQPCSE